MNTPDPAIPALETTRLRLRPLGDTDQQLYIDLYTGPDTMRYVGRPLTREKAVAYFKRAVHRQSEPSPGGKVFVIEEKSTQHRLGICATANFDGQAASIETGVMLLPPFRAQGYARETLTALVDGIFTHAPVDEVRVQFSGLSLAAARLSERVGLRPPASAPQDTGAPSMRTWSIHKTTWQLQQRPDSTLSQR